MKNIIIKSLGLRDEINKAVNSSIQDLTDKVENIEEETNCRLRDVEDLPSTVEELESNLSDLSDKVDNIESAEYVGADWVTDEIESAKSELSDELEEKIAEAISEEKVMIATEQVEEIIKKVLTKELILSILAK